MAYQPAVNTTGSAGLAHQATVYYDRRGLDKLREMFRFAQVCEAKPLPKNSGRTIQFFRFSNTSQNTNPASEGVVGSGVALASSTLSATVEEYNDFTSSSQLLEDTDIAPFVEEMVDGMSYRAAKTVDVLARTEIDSNSDAEVGTLGAYFSAADARSAVTDLRALNIMPHTGDDFIGVIHPYVEFDLVSDNTAGGFIDALKYSQGVRVLNGEIGKVGGVRFMSTTNVGTEGSSPNVLYNTYVFGKGGIGMVDLSGSGPNQIVDPNNQRFQTFVSKGGPSAVDPAGTIGTYVAYRFVTAFKTLDSTNERFRIIQADASKV